MDDIIQGSETPGLCNRVPLRPGLAEESTAVEDGYSDRVSQECRRPVILCFVASYLPGYRSGGPVRTTANFVDHLGDEFDIRIVTRDRDALDSEPYPNVAVDAWNTVGKAQVFYASARTMRLPRIARLIRETQHDILYLNSFFGARFTILPLLARRLGLIPQKPCVLAPRGEFSRGALALKAWKKRAYVAIAQFMGLYSGLRWQASSAFEIQDLQRGLALRASDITVAPNLPRMVSSVEDAFLDVSPRPDRAFRIIFLSRISPMKNLEHLLLALADVSAEVVLSIVGPIEVQAYWDQCRNLIDALPSNVSVRYGGETRPESVADAFSQHDLFVLPTRGENFGHVIYESLAAGTPVLLSDQTPWLADHDGALEVLPLSDVRDWSRAIERWSGFDDNTLRERRSAALNYARKHSESQVALEQNRALFLDLVADAGQQLAREK